MNSYYDFKIKGLEGIFFYVFFENGNRDLFVFCCVLLEVSEIFEIFLDVLLVLKSVRKNYILREVVGR